TMDIVAKAFGRSPGRGVRHPELPTRVLRRRPGICRERFAGAAAGAEESDRRVARCDGLLEGTERPCIAESPPNQILEVVTTRTSAELGADPPRRLAATR